MRSTTFILLAAFVAVSFFTTAAYAVKPPEEVWNKVYGSGNDNWVFGLAVDGEGFSYVTGKCEDFPNQNYLTIKLDKDGNIQWDKVYDSGFNDWAFGIVTDEEGFIYVTGGCGNGDCLTIKYDKDGNETWHKVYNIGEPSEGIGVMVDGEGFIYVTGASGIYPNQNYLTIKYDNDGNEIWHKLYDSGGDDRPIGVGVDGSGFVYVAGNDFRTIKYDSDGNVLWNKVYDAGDYDEAYGVAVDDSGFVYVTGYSYNGSNFDFRTIKYDSEGNLQWDKIYDSGNDDFAYGVAVDGSGFVYVAGYSYNDSNNGFRTIKYDPDGNIEWDKVEGSPRTPIGVRLDRGGYIYVAGGRGECWTIKYRQFLSISGHISGATDVAIELGGTVSDTVTTDATGYYEFLNLPCGEDYTVTPHKEGCTFIPPSRSYTPLGYNQLNQDFTANTGIEERRLTSGKFELIVDASGSKLVNIRYQLPASSAVNLSIYDALGRSVAVLREGQELAGEHEYLWQPQTSGVYFVRLTADQGVVSARFVYVR